MHRFCITRLTLEVEGVQEKPELIDIVYFSDFHVFRFAVCSFVPCAFEETDSVRIMLLKLAPFHDIAQPDATVCTAFVSLLQQDGVAAVFPLVAFARKIE